MGWRRYVRQHSDGSWRIHPSYKVMMMSSLRCGCGDPNFQQVPSHSIGAKHFKKIFTAPPGYYQVGMDYSSFQMRLAAIDSEDPVLMKEYRSNPNVDMHSKTAYNVFCKESKFDVDEVVVCQPGVPDRVYFAHETIKVTRSGIAVEVKASELLETDEIRG